VGPNQRPKGRANWDSECVQLYIPFTREWCININRTRGLTVLFCIDLNVSQLNPLRSQAFASTEVYLNPVQIRDYPNIHTVTTQDRTWTDIKTAVGGPTSDLLTIRKPWPWCKWDRPIDIGLVKFKENIAFNVQASRLDKQTAGNQCLTRRCALLCHQL
jgi:hypothetical protein